MNECPSIEVLESIGFDESTTFGVEFEFYCVDEDRDGVASYLEEKTGISTHSEHYNHVDNDHYWKIVSDASLDSYEEDGAYECENCDVSRECDEDCAYSCTPTYDCNECLVHTYDGPEKERPECDDCAILNDYPEYHCEDCSQDRECDNDCSYHCSRSSSGKGGMELVSPILLGHKGMKQVHAMLEALESLDCSVDESCGMHIHLDGESLTHRAMKQLASLYVKYEATIDSILPASRRNNRNCKSMCSQRWGSRNYGHELPRLARLAQKFDEIDSASVCNELLGIWRDRFIKLNLEALVDHGTVEFRQHGGTLNFEKTLHWIILCMNMRIRATKSQKVRLSPDEYPSLEVMMDELGASKENREFWDKRRNLFAEEVSERRTSDDACDEERRLHYERRDHDTRVAAQESLRWNADRDEAGSPAPWLTWNYPVNLSNSVWETYTRDIEFWAAFGQAAEDRARPQLTNADGSPLTWNTQEAPPTPFADLISAMNVA